MVSEGGGRVVGIHKKLGPQDDHIVPGGEGGEEGEEGVENVGGEQEGLCRLGCGVRRCQWRVHMKMMSSLW